jgi:hypothetical protein
MDNSTWAWSAADGRRYHPGRIPAVWRRAADRSPEECATWLGPLAWPPVGNATHSDKQPSSWTAFHGLLTRVAALWRTLPGESEVEHLLTAEWQPVIPRAVLDLQDFLSTLARAHEFEVRVSDDRFAAEAVPLTLRSFLVARCAYDIKIAARFRHCDWCHEWFTPFRTDALFCSAACRNQSHRAGQFDPKISGEGL